MTDVRVLTTAELGPDLGVRLRRLMDEAFDGDFDDDDWGHALGGWHVVVSSGTELVAHAAVVPRLLLVADHPFRSGYIEAVGTAPAWHGQGVGSAAMEEAAVVVREHFELGALATGRWSFYERLGWERWAGPTFVRDGDEVVRTEDDDDALMVLRFGPSASIDLADPLTCEIRPGDVW